MPQRPLGRKALALLDARDVGGRAARPGDVALAEALPVTQAQEPLADLDRGASVGRES